MANLTLNYASDIMHGVVKQKRQTRSIKQYYGINTGDKAKLCYTDTDSFITHIVTEDFLEHISNDVESWYDKSNYDEKDKRPIAIGKNKNVIGLFKDELRERIMK